MSFDPYREASQRGYSVILADLPFGDSWVSEPDRTLIVRQGVSDAAVRAWVATLLAQFEVEQAFVGSDRPASPALIVSAALRLASRYLVPLDSLVTAVRMDSDPFTVAERLGTTTTMLGVRAAALAECERMLLAGQGLAWDRYYVDSTYEGVRVLADGRAFLTRWHLEPGARAAVPMDLSVMVGEIEPGTLCPRLAVPAPAPGVQV